MAVLVAASVVGLVLYNAEVRKERDEKNIALEAAKEQRLKAEANLHHALDAIELMLKQVNDGALASAPRMDEVRMKISADALELCKQLLKDEGAGPEARFCTARAFYLAGTIKFNAGQAAAGEEDIRRALDLYQALARDLPNSGAYRSSWANASLEWAMSLQRLGRLDEAERWRVRRWCFGASCASQSSRSGLPRAACQRDFSARLRAVVIGSPGGGRGGL